MIICPNCQHHEAEGALFCSECGTQLVRYDGKPTKSMHNPTNPLGEKDTVINPEYPQNVSSDAEVSLHILDAGQIIPLSGRAEYNVGRSAEGQSVLPEIDLTSFHAFENGVSRIHACIKVVEHKVTVADLGSVNGTFINGKKIQPQQSYSLNHGDILTLGKLKVQVLIRR